MCRLQHATALRASSGEAACRSPGTNLPTRCQKCATDLFPSRLAELKISGEANQANRRCGSRIAAERGEGARSSTRGWRPQPGSHRKGSNQDNGPGHSAIQERGSTRPVFTWVMAPASSGVLNPCFDSCRLAGTSSQSCDRGLLLARWFVRESAALPAGFCRQRRRGLSRPDKLFTRIGYRRPLFCGGSKG